MSNSHQKLGRFIREQLRLLTADPNANGAPHSVSFDVPLHRDGKRTEILVVLVLPSRRDGVMRAVHEAAGVAYEWSWNPSVLLVHYYKLGQFLRDQAREAVYSGSVWFGDLPMHTGTGEPIDATVILVPPACRHAVMRSLFELDDLGRSQR